MFELAGGEQIAYCSSFSKTVAPGVRVGWYVLPSQLAAEIEALAVSTYISPPYLSQATVLEFLLQDSFGPNLERVNGLLRERRDAMFDALARELPEDASWTRPEGGYFVWVELPSGPPTSELLAEAEEAGVTFVKGSDFFAGGRGGERALRLAFSFVSPDEIAEGVSVLGSLVRAAAPAPRKLPEQDPAEQADAEREQDQPDERHTGRREHEVDVHLLPVLEDEGDRVGNEQPQQDQAQIEPRLPAVADLAGVDPRAAQAAHTRILRTRRRRVRKAREAPGAVAAARPAFRRTGPGTSGR
jgi:hypothetical protein